MKSRTKNVMLNVSSSFIITIIKTILTFINRTIFIYCLGKQALGLNGLFTNILSMLSLAELGIGTAINFSLYKPLAEKNEKKISILMSFYKKTYRIIGICVAILGICLMPFLKFLIKDISSIENVYIIFIFYLINTVSSYFISYKETLINADQKKYKLIKIEVLFITILNFFQIIVLLITKNFIYYLGIQILIQLIQRIAVNFYINKMYKNIDFNSKQKIEKKDMQLIKKNVKAMFFHKIGDYCINGTDNLIISSFINISIVGLYSNYLTIIALLNTFINLIYSNLTSSLGNLVVTETDEKKYEIFKIMDYIGYILYGFSAVILICIFNDFISIWIGNQYCIEYISVILIVTNFYLAGMRVPASTLKSAAGLYDVDKFTPLIQSIINLFFSIILVKKIGLLGVIVGTTISSILLPSWQRPYIVYKYIFKKSVVEYYIKYVKYLVVISISTLLTLLISNYIYLDNIFIILICKIVISSILFTIFSYLLFGKTEEINYIKGIVKKITKRSKKNEK